ncbi:hypothetical protein NX059_009201 [Plenodomus lindquistii]|nr:hypothetical protein NX059_009201 [Plenodomus lindquistii]
MSIPTFHYDDLYPVPFPDDVPTAPLESISLLQLDAGDAGAIQRVGHAMRHVGFFYLDLRGHEVGMELLREAVECCRLIKDTLTGLPVERKEQYKIREELGAFDRGYIAKKSPVDGSALHETYNIPAKELMADPPTPVLPPWLATHEATYRSALQHASQISGTLLRIFEGELGLPAGALQQLHDITQPSGTFLRLLRYPGKPAERANLEHELTFPAHKDYSTVSLLFNWLGGLQVQRSASLGHAPDARDEVPEDDWVWVRPQPGHLLVNGGWMLENFSNKAMRAGWHRVMNAPGNQAPFDKFSVLFGMRPLDIAPMRALDEAVAPKGNILSCKEWTAQGISSFINRVSQEEQSLLPTITVRS